MKNVVLYNELYDIYGNILTEAENKYFIAYYVNDESLKEISDAYKVSRSAVSKSINLAERKLQRLDDMLMINIKKKKMLNLLQKKDYSNLENEIKNL